ncbi:MAG: hypothetical protein ACK4G1_02080, partial [Ignavibacteria bacterium]
MRTRNIIFLLFILYTIAYQVAISQSKVINAFKVNGKPNIDGLINDSLWLYAEPISDFLQQEPIAGKPPSFKTEVRILYNENSLFIGVMCYDPEPDKIIARELKKDGNLRGD